MTPAFALLDTPLTPGVTLLEASAGTGKTYALAAIYLRLIAEESLTVRQIAVTTYTIPATAELRDRIRARLAEAVAALEGTPATTPFVSDLAAKHAGDQAMARRLAEAVRDFDEASISTIHGFCQRILRDRAFESGSAPEVELVPDQSTLLREVAEDFWRRHYSAPHPGSTPLALLAKLTPDTLAELYAKCAHQPKARLRPSWTEQPAAEAEALRQLAEFRQHWPAWKNEVHQLFVEAPRWAIGAWKDTAASAAQIEVVDRLASDPAAPLLCYAALGHFRITTIVNKKGVSKKTGPPAHPFLDWCEQFFEAVDRYAATTKSAFLHWAEGEITQRRDAQGILGFEDLLKRLHEALEGPGGEALINAVRQRFSASLVDEFQDTDPTQDAIFRKLFAEDPTHRLFLIGDPKQAIYSFRGADLHTYTEAKQRAKRRFALKTNHRSDEPLIRAVNHLFSRPASPFVSEIGFEPTDAARAASERLLRVRGEVRAPLRFAFWDAEAPITSDSAQESLPGATAAAIIQLLGEATLQDRPLRPSDIAVLCWKNSQCRQVQAALSTRGVPAVVLNSESVLQSREAEEMRIILSALARPTFEPGVRAALATSLFGLNARDLDALSNDGPAWEGWTEQFATAHARWRNRGFIQMFRELLRDHHTRTRLLTLPDGERRLTNFLHLSELLQQAAREFTLGPAALVRWLADEIETVTASDDSELRLESDEDAVKVLTIHKSKGLEWPVVFCPFLWTKATPRPQPNVLFHEGSKAVIDLGSDQLEAARQAAAGEHLEENVRLLYVALTRARHECHVVWGRFKDCTNSAMMWLLETPPAIGASAPEALIAHAENFESAHLRRSLDQIVAEQPDCFAVDPLLLETKDAVLTRPNLREGSSPPALHARHFSGQIDRTWRVNSFSSLIAGVESGADYDAETRPRVVEGELQGIHAFPRGARAGVCLHDVFESLDFQQDGSIEGLVANKLRSHDLFSADRVDAVAHCVRQTLRTDLHGAQLREIPTARTLRELEFHLPAALLPAEELSSICGAELQFDPRRGLLTGFIDLIFEHEGRFHIVDWKSNFLGATEQDYTAEAVSAEMARHRYGLQWRLYLLALHRFLATRLPAYSPKQHLGGIHYLFIRGLAPEHPDLGLFQATPNLEELAALDALFTP